MVVLVLWEGLYCTWAGGSGFPASAAGVVVERDGLVLEADGVARRAGVRPGLPVAAARRLCRGLEVAFVGHDPFGVVPLVETFRAACVRLTPAVEPVGERAVLLGLGAAADAAAALSRLAGELRGRGVLLAGAGAGRGVAVAAARLARRLAAGRQGGAACWPPSARGVGAVGAGVPTGPHRPRLLHRPARDGGLPLHVVAVPGSAGASFLSSCPLSFLVPPERRAGSAERRGGLTGSPFLGEAEVAVLARLGVRTCGELLSLPPSLLSQAVGAEAAARMTALCRGEAGPPVEPRWPPPEVVWRSGEGVAAGFPLWREAARILAERLGARGWAARELHLEWEGELGLRRAVRVLATPIREEARMRDVLAALAERLAREAAVAGAGRKAEGGEGGLSLGPSSLRGLFAVRARGVVPAPLQQLSLGGNVSGAAGGREERLARALAALGTRLGRCAVGGRGEKALGSEGLPGGGGRGAGVERLPSAGRESRLEHWDPQRWRRTTLP